MQQRKAEIRPLVSEAWDEYIRSNALLTLLKSIPRRFREVKANRRGYTSY